MEKDIKQQITNLQGQVNEINRQLEILKNIPQKVALPKFKDNDNYEIIRVNNLILRFVSQATEPVILSNEIVLWQDTDDNKTYIVANFNGTINHIELV